MNLMRLILYTASLIFLLPQLGADTVTLDWAVRLKRPLPSVANSEFAGVKMAGEHLLVTMRDGTFLVVDNDGTILVQRELGSEIVFPAVVTEDMVIVPVSDALVVMNRSYEIQWRRKLKSPPVAAPLVHEDGIYLRLYNNALYLFDMETGASRASYTDYAGHDMPYIMLSTPFVSGDKIVAGFPDGKIIHFKTFFDKVSGEYEIVPYYKMKVHDAVFSTGSRRFHDVFSIVPVRDDLLYSTGESGGVVIDSEKIVRKEMRNRRLFRHADDRILGYGEGGAALYDAAGMMKRSLFETTNFVSSCARSEALYVFAEAGPAPFFSRNRKRIRIWDRDLQRELYTLVIDGGVSGKISVRGRTFYVLSDFGTLYAFTYHGKKVDKYLNNISE